MPRRFVAGVVAQRVQDEALVDGRLHGVTVKRHRRVGLAGRLGRLGWILPPTKQTERALLGPGR